MRTSNITCQGQRDTETGEPDDAISIKSGSEGGWEKRPAMDLARSLPNDGTRISRPSACGGQATIVALFIPGGEGNPHDVLLANVLQNSSSTFSRVSFPRFFAFQDGM
jgi:hypothetical protein